VKGQDGKQLADGWRDVINAGMKALNIPQAEENPPK
jgi:hypothetical protein